MESTTELPDERAPAPLPEPELLKQSQILALLNIHTVSFWRLRKKGIFPPPVHPMGLNKSGRASGLRWRRADVERWLAELQ